MSGIVDLGAIRRIKEAQDKDKKERQKSQLQFLVGNGALEIVMAIHGLSLAGASDNQMLVAFLAKKCNLTLGMIAEAYGWPPDKDPPIVFIPSIKVAVDEATKERRVELTYQIQGPLAEAASATVANMLPKFSLKEFLTDVPEGIQVDPEKVDG